jgi:hypothetical protein
LHSPFYVELSPEKSGATSPATIVKGCNNRACAFCNDILVQTLPLIGGCKMFNIRLADLSQRSGKSCTASYAIVH